MSLPKSNSTQKSGNKKGCDAYKTLYIFLEVNQLWYLSLQPLKLRILHLWYLLVRNLVGKVDRLDEKLAPYFLDNTGCRVFKGGIHKRGFWLKINCSQMKSFNFANRCNGEVSKSTEIWLSKSICYIKNYLTFSDFFSLKNTNLGTIFLFWHFW